MIFPSGGDLLSSKFKYHLGSSYIIAYLKENGYEAEQFVSNENFNVGECVKKIAEYKPKIVGFTVYEKNFMQCALISRGLKAFNSDIIIIFGGPTPSVQSQEIMDRVRSVDLCVRWEGEETMLKLLFTLSTNSFKLNRANLDKINGITFRKEKEIHINPNSNILLSNTSTKYYLDKYPSPYLSETIPASAAFPTGVITTRGCNQNCVYCNCAIMSKRNLFLHSVERVIEELLYLNEYRDFKGPIPINDDGFTIIPARAKRICEKIIYNNIKLPLSCITRCDKTTEELLDLMKQAGIVSVGFSLESAVPKVLRAIGKVNPPESSNLENYNKEKLFIEKLKTMTSYAKKIGMQPVFVSIMVGLPNESIQDAQKTIDLVNKLDIDFYSHNKFHIYRGTPIYHNFKKYGYNITPIGNKNKIFINNDFPFDVFKIKLGPKAVTEKSRKLIDYNTLKVLSLNPKRDILRPFFRNVIVNVDIIKTPLVKWIQENLAINGTIIQLYSEKLKYKELHKSNETTLYDEFSPTMYYESYYWEHSDGTSTLKSGESLVLGEKIGFPIEMKASNLAMEEYKANSYNMDNIVCVDHNIIDTRAIINLLNEISNSGSGFNFLLNKKPLPNIQQLCRWTSSSGNCLNLETAIIGPDNSIRICWYSNPIGNIENSFSDIIRNLEHLKKEVIESRNCLTCVKNATCIKCLFPFPLSTKKYCQFKNDLETNEVAKLIISFNISKDLLIKPSNRLKIKN